MRIRVIGFFVVLALVLLPARGRSVGEATSLLKSFSPTTILDGGVTVLTFTLTSSVGVPDLTNVTFTDTLPSSLRVANTTVTGTCANAAAATTVTAGGTTVVVTNLDVPGVGQSCTVQVNITNVLGQLNASCGTNPAAFTNASGNVSSSNFTVSTAQTVASCLVVNAAVPALPRWMLVVLAVALLGAAGAAARRRTVLS